MDYYGLYPKFKMNRPLNEKEKEGRLWQRQATLLEDVDGLVSDISVIKINAKEFCNLILLPFNTMKCRCVCKIKTGAKCGAHDIGG